MPKKKEQKFNADNHPVRKAEFDPEREAYMSKDGGYICCQRVQQPNGLWVLKPTCTVNIGENEVASEITIVLDDMASLIREQNTKLIEANAIQAQQIAEMLPKASYYDICLACMDLLSITEIAKDYGWSGRKMNEWLNEQGVQFKQGNIWLLYQKYTQLGYTSTKTHVHPGKDGNLHTTVHTYWTQKGRLFIYQIMKADGHLPTMEQDD